MKSAFIVGFTGEVGKEIVKEAVAKKVFSSLVLVGRRKIDYDDQSLKILEQRVVDFDKLDEYSNTFQGFDVGLCCLGTTKGKAGAEGFRKVDHDYIVKTAELAKREGCHEFHLISSQGANKDSSFLYPKTKGETEEDLKKLGFKKLVIYRPGMLLGDRQENRPIEKVVGVLLKPITWAFPTRISIPMTMLAKVVVLKAAEPPAEIPIEVLENNEIHSVAV